MEKWLILREFLILCLLQHSQYCRLLTATRSSDVLISMRKKKNFMARVNPKYKKNDTYNHEKNINSTIGHGLLYRWGRDIDPPSCS